MVVRVRQAMIVPHSVQGGANGCQVAIHLRSGWDLGLQSATMEKKLKGGVENGRQGGHESVVAWQRTASESSISSLDSVPAGELGFSPSDIPPSLYHRKARLGLHASESEDESMPDSMQEDSITKKSKRPMIGGIAQSHPAAPFNLDEGDPEAGPATNRDFPVYFEGGKHFRVRISPIWLASARKVSSGLDDYNESCGSEDAFPSSGYALSNLADGFSSCKAPSATDSLPSFRYQFESHSGSCCVGMGSVGADHGSTQSDDGKDPSSRVKFMCSFGGKIFPRPSDGKLRYVGGDTKIIAVHRDTSFGELMSKMKEVYGKCTLKYQLPDEDLDALVSVSSNEDLQNMMEEYDKLERADGSSRLRVFLFPAVDYDSSHRKDSSGDLRNSEQRYVDAVNGIPEAGPRSRIESYVGGAPNFPLENLMGMDVPETWSLPRGQDAVPVAMVAPQISHDVASHMLRVPVAVPVSTIASRSNAPSAPSSAPSSPPLLPRQALGKLPVVSDIHLQYHQDTHVKLAAQYNVLVAEGNYQDNDSFGGSGASSAPSQHEPLYRSSDSRRGPDSPPRKQHEGGHQEHLLRADQQRRVTDSRVPRVSSHGKLSRLAEHVDVAPSSTSDTQQLPEVLEMQRLMQQQQHQSLHQAVWQHPMDPQQDNYRRADLLQSTIPQNAVLGQQQQAYPKHQPVLFRTGLSQGQSAHEAGYRQGDQQQQYTEEVLHHMPRSVSSHVMTAGVPSGHQSTSYHVGSAPSSPRLTYREVPSRHVPGPQLPIHWAFSGAPFAEQSSSGRRKNYDQSGRSFRLSKSPPKYRDHLIHTEERLIRQQQQQQQAHGNSDSLHHEQVPKSAQLLYEANPVAQSFDLLSRPQVPLYKGLNPFQEKHIPYQDHSFQEKHIPYQDQQEIGEVRRHQLPQQEKHIPYQDHQEIGDARRHQLPQQEKLIPYQDHQELGDARRHQLSQQEKLIPYQDHQELGDARRHQLSQQEKLIPYQDHQEPGDARRHQLSQQEKLIPYQDHQEAGDARRHQLPQQGKESQFLSGQHLQSLHQNQRLDYHDTSPQQAEQLSGNPRYQEASLKVPEWDSDEARLGFRGRVRTGLLDDELHLDSGAAHQRELQQASFPGLHLPETSDDLLAASVGDYTSLHSKNDRVDHPGNIGFPFRPGMLPPSALSGYPGPKPRPNLSDSSGVPRYGTRSNEPDYLAAGGLRTGGNGQDIRAPLFEVNGHQHTASGLVQGLHLPPSHRVEERSATTAFNPHPQQLQNLRLGDTMMLGNETRWNGGLGPDDVRIEIPMQGRDLLGSFQEDRLQGLPNMALSSRGSRLSRPSSSTNIPSLIEEERAEVSHAHPYGTQCRSSIHMDEDALHQYAVQSIPVTEKLLFTSNNSRYVNPSPHIEMGVTTPAGMFAFDPTPHTSLSSDSRILTTPDGLPNIKTTATQVPSVEGDELGGSAGTTGRSDHSLSHRGSGEHFLGQLTMTQHLAEDMASCVLESSPIKVASEVEPEHTSEGSVGAQAESMWPLEPSPTLSPTLWENALDDAVVTKDKKSVERLQLEKEPLKEAMETPTSIIKDEDSEEVLVGALDLEEECSTVKNDADAAADEAIAHGLQTIKNADLEELRELGSGTFGTVYHGKWRGTDVAIKRIKASCFAGRPSEQERLIADFWREACNLGNLHHPNVVAFYGVVSDGPGGTLATVTEYMVNGSLKQVLQKKDRTIDRRKRLLIAMDSAFGMEYLHGKNIVHFDLKCENLLVNMRDPHRPICKVGDLGLSKVKHQTMVSGGVRGTLPWMAPELLSGSSSLVTEKVDVFSFGIVMWELLTGEEPYANMHYGAIIGGIVNNTLRPPIPTWCDPAWRSLMERSWSSDPASRPSFSEIASELRGMSEGLKPKSQLHPQGQQSPSMQVQG